MNNGKNRWGRNDWILLLIGLLPAVFGILIYNQLPESLITHWGVSGEPDGYTGKFTFLLLFGALNPGLPILMKITRRIDPKSDNYEKFAFAYELIRFALTVFLSGMMVFVLLYNLGYEMNIQMFVLLFMGILFLILGNYMGQFRTNYFAGIRTPWTLANEEVWRKTHRLAGPLWMASGLVAIVCAFLPGIIAFWVFMATIAIIVLGPTIYSYVIFRRLPK